MFKSIENFEGLYEVSNLGIVRSIARTVTNKHGKAQHYPSKVLKSCKGVHGHARVVLSKNHIRYRYLVHRLVAEAFIPNPENKPFINHIDNVPSNNHVSNLEWCTHSENMLHAQQQGRLFKSQSAGGMNGGESTRKSNSIASDMVGKVFACWRVVTLADRRGKKQYFNVICTSCATPYTREKSYLKQSKQLRCIKCKIKI